MGTSQILHSKVNILVLIVLVMRARAVFSHRRAKRSPVVPPAGGAKEKEEFFLSCDVQFTFKSPQLKYNAHITLLKKSQCSLCTKHLILRGDYRQKDTLRTMLRADAPSHTINLLVAADFVDPAAFCSLHHVKMCLFVTVRGILFVCMCAVYYIHTHTTALWGLQLHYIVQFCIVWWR